MGELVIRAETAGSRVKGEISFFIYNEIVFVILLMAWNLGTDGKKAVRVVRTDAGAHEYLAQGLEMTSLEVRVGRFPRGRRFFDAGEEKGIKEPCPVVFPVVFRQRIP